MFQAGAERRIQPIEVFGTSAEQKELKNAKAGEPGIAKGRLQFARVCTGEGIFRAKESREQKGRVGKKKTSPWGTRLGGGGGGLQAKRISS